MTRRLPYYCAASLAFAIAAASLFYGFSIVAYGAAAVASVIVIASVVTPEENLRSKRHAVRLQSFALSDRDFSRHGICVGQPGTGKTELFKRILAELLYNRPDFGALLNDEKGDIHIIVKQTLAGHGRMDKLIELRPRMYGQPGTPPKFRMNLIGDRSISWTSHAQLVVDTAISQGQKTTQPHFKNQAQDRIADAMETLHLAGSPVTLENVYEFIKFPNIFDEQIEAMMNNEKDPDRANVLYDSWRQYLAKAPEELSGIRGTVENYLAPYTEPEIAEVFCSDDPNVDIHALDAGKILLISIPQQFTRARKYIQAYGKILYYRDSLGRYDRFETTGFDQLNLHWGGFDEGHNSLLASEDGYSDFNTLDKMRAAKCPVWFFMQCYTSAVPPLGSEPKVKVLKANIGTHVIYRLASEDGRKLASQVIGEHEVMEASRSVTRGVTTVSRTPKVKPVLGTWVFRKLPDFTAIARHPNDQVDYRRLRLPPITDDGKGIAPWYWKHCIKKFIGLD